MKMQNKETDQCQYPPCNKRKIVGGFDMCYAIGCCEIGDMYCECGSCQHNDSGTCLERSKSTK